MMTLTTQSQPTEFKMFPVDRIVDNSVTDFDLFIDVSKHLVLYGPEGYHWTRRELTHLLSSGFTHFLIRPQDEHKVTVYEQVSKIPLIEKSLAPHERIQSLEQVGVVLVQCLHESGVTLGAVEKAKQVAESISACVAEDTSCVQALGGLADHDYYTYYHSVRVAAYTTAICVEMGLTDETMLRDITLGGIFHDIGKKTVPIDVINKTGALTAKEWDLMRRHPAEGISAIADTILSHTPREIILHHHEKLDGSGYPDALDANSLMLEVQIATVADVFDALTSSRSYQNKRSRFEALDFIRHNMVGSKLANEPFRALISCLAKDEKSKIAA